MSQTEQTTSLIKTIKHFPLENTKNHYLCRKISIKMAKKLIRFDWAMKKMLRHKANFDILEGFLTELLGGEIHIKQVLESEGNKEHADDKFNRVDMLVENHKGELVIIEVQNTQEHDYFHRMLFGASKAITENIKEKQAYANVKKIISITIAYFDLGQGKDYVYHGTTVFRGIHKGDILGLSETQVETYKLSKVQEIYPEYWVIKTGKFKNKVKDTLDEWIYFLKNAEIKPNFSAKGLKEANEKLDAMKLPEKERKAYDAYLRHMMSIASRNHNIEIEAIPIIKKAKEEALSEVIMVMHKDNVPTKTIAKYVNISEERVLQIIDSQVNK
jgi:predicted transposase/invertase (TIGR01784 family)